MDILLHKSGAFHCGQEFGALHPIVIMVYARILPRQGRRQLGISRGQAGPQLRADGRAHAAVELVVVKPRHRRAQAAAEVLLRHAVFVTHKAQGFRLGFGEIFPMHRQAVAAHRLQEHHLQIQIVVGYHFGEHGIVLAEIQQLLLPFIGISQGASCFCP